jgi:cbb3-type cytochrome oxidase subunit 3
MKIPHKWGVMLILLFSVGSTIADSMFRLLSMAYDGFFSALIIFIVLNMAKKDNQEEAK